MIAQYKGIYILFIKDRLNTPKDDYNWPDTPGCKTGRDASTLSFSRRMLRINNADMSTNISSKLLLKSNLRPIMSRSGGDAKNNSEVNYETLKLLDQQNMQFNDELSEDKDPLEYSIRWMENGFNALHKLEKDTGENLKLFNSSISRLSFIQSTNIGK